MTGFLAKVRGFSITNESTSVRLTIGGSNRGGHQERRQRRRRRGIGGACGPAGAPGQLRQSRARGIANLRRAATVQATDVRRPDPSQNPKRTPSRISLSSYCRPVRLVLVITPNPLRLRTVPSAFNCRLEAFEAGLAKCGVFVALSASIRSCRLIRSLNRNVRNRLASMFAMSGPRRALKPELPKRTAVTGRKAVTSK